MEFEQLYALRLEGKRTALHVESRDEDLDALAIYRGDTRPSLPILFEYKKGASGSKPYDFVGTTWAILDLISDRVVEALKPFTGWATYPVTVYGKKGELIPGYHGLIVSGRCGPIDNSRSEPRICAPPVPEGRWSRRWFGLYFDEKTWDGSDIFAPEDTALTVVVEAVRWALRKAKITNVKLTPLTECENHSVPAESV